MRHIRAVTARLFPYRIAVTRRAARPLSAATRAQRSRRRILPALCAFGMATLTFGLLIGVTASPALADLAVTVPCAGNPSTSGPQGLVNAITAANTYGAAHPGHKTEINVANACAYDLTIQYNTYDSSPTALPQITSTIVINGQGGTHEPAIIMRSVASGTLPFRLIDVASNGNLTLNSIQVTNGLTPDGAPWTLVNGAENGNSAPDGGGIYSSGNLTLQDSVVSGNATGSGSTGGSNASGNANGGNGGNGGGIYNNGGTLTAKNGVSISGNATGNGGNGGGFAPYFNTGNANGGNGGNGGGIATVGSGTVNLRDNTTLSSNSTGNGGHGGAAEGTTTGGNGGNGGSSYSAGGSTVQINGGDTNLEQSNTGTAGGGGEEFGGGSGVPGTAGDGGGLFTSGVVSTNGTNFTENIAGGPQQSTSGTGNGGGLAAEGGAKVTIRQGSFTWNVASTGGAVHDDYPTSTVTVSGTMFADNTPNNCTPSGGGCPA
ncbi:MAG: hypothetical protein WB793_06270 [Candidatus Dormiibacterota bacterium]